MIEINKNCLLGRGRGRGGFRHINGHLPELGEQVEDELDEEFKRIQSLPMGSDLT